MKQRFKRSSRFPPHRRSASDRNKGKAKKLLDRLGSYKTETLRFMTDFHVPLITIKWNGIFVCASSSRKFRELSIRNTEGICFFEFVAICHRLKKQDHNMLTTLTLCFQGATLNLVGAE